MSRQTARCLVLVLILLLATGLRLYRLDTQSLWNDEGNAARAAERPVHLIVAAARADIHPPAYYLLLHVWRGLAGDSEYALRALSAFCGVLTVALTYTLGRRLSGEGTGTGASLLAALSPLSVYYSQEARMYALLGLLSVTSTYLLYQMARAGNLNDGGSCKRGPGSLAAPTAAYVVSAAVGLFTHYFFPFVLLTHNLLFLAWWAGRGFGRAGPWRVLLGWAAVQTAVLALFLPWVPAAVGAVTGWPASGRGLPLAAAVQDVARALAVGVTLEGDAAHWSMAAAGVMLAFALWPTCDPGTAARRSWLRSTGGPVLWLALPVAFFFAFGLYRPAYLKFLLAVLPPYHLLLARGVGNLARLTGRLVRSASPAVRALCYLLLVAVVVPSLRNLYFDARYARDDYRQIATDITAQARARDAVLLNAPNQWEVFTYYFHEPTPVYPAPYHPAREEVAGWLTPLLADHQRLFVLYWGDSEADPGALVESRLATHAYPAASWWYGDVRVALYGTGALPDEPEVVLNARLGDHIRLHGYSLPDGPFAPGDVIPVTLFWETDAPLAERYKVFLHLVDGDGRLVAQTDAEPGGNLLPTVDWPIGAVLTDRHGVLLPPALPSGEYTLAAGLYHVASGERLTVTVNGEPEGDHLILGTVLLSH